MDALDEVIGTQSGVPDAVPLLTSRRFQTSDRWRVLSESNSLGWVSLLYEVYEP